jgi:hypothetical protein
MQGEDLVVTCYYIDSGMNAFAISPAQVSSATPILLFNQSLTECSAGFAACALVLIEFVTHASEFLLSTAKHTCSFLPFQSNALTAAKCTRSSWPIFYSHTPWLLVFFLIQT